MAGPSAAVFKEDISPHLSVVSQLEGILAQEQSDFQAIDVVQLNPWGKCLVLDGHMQSAEHDEFLYHEMLVHPAIASAFLSAEGNDMISGPKRVFIGGGGEGATCREVLKYPSVERLVMVDIDGPCVDLCKKYLPGHHQGSFDDPRCEVAIDDAKAWLEKTTEKFDVIILDLADPLEEGPCVALYTEKFYRMCVEKLTDGGVLVTQSGPAGALTHHYCFTAIHNTLSRVFPTVRAHSVFVPSFFDHWGFNVGYKSIGFCYEEVTAHDIDAALETMLGTDGVNALRCYDGKFHTAAATFPKCIREAFATEQRIVTEENLVAIP
jgi:spermidine synthase